MRASHVIYRHWRQLTCLIGRLIKGFVGDLMGIRPITKHLFLASAAIGLVMTTAPVAMAQQGTAADIQMRVQGPPDGGQGQVSGDPLALYGMDTGQRAEGMSYSDAENQRMREFERRRANMMRGFANGTAGTASSQTRGVSEQEIRRGLVYDEAEDARIEASNQRQSDRQAAVIDEEMSRNSNGGGISGPSNASNEAIQRNISLVEPSAINQAEAFNETVEDFQAELGQLGGDGNAECVMASSSAGCPMNNDRSNASYEQGLHTDIMNPAASGAGQSGGMVPPVTTTFADLEEPAAEVPAEFQDRFNQETITISTQPGRGSFAPNGEPINLDDLTWQGYMQTEEERSMSYEKYLEYKVWGFDMSGFQWFGDNRFLMPRNFFLREEIELGPRQTMVPQDRQIAYDDRLITFHQYHDMIRDRYNMSGVIYFGDELDIQIIDQWNYTCDRYLLQQDDDDGWNRYREPWYCDREAYELPVDFFERQDRNPGWQARLNYRGYNNDNDR